MAGQNTEINIGKLCDSACVFCGNGGVPREERVFVPVADLIAEIERAGAAGGGSIGFLGGEICAHPGVLEIVSAAKRAGFDRISICTNGRRLSDRALLEAVLSAGVTRVALSIHSHEEGVEDLLNGRTGAFAQKVAAIGNLVRAAGGGALRHGFSLNSCIHGLNHRKLPAMAAYFCNLGVRDMRFNMIRPEHRAVGDKTLVPGLTECIPGMVDLVVLNERSLKMTVTFGDIPLCLWPGQLLGNAELARRYIGEFRDMDTEVVVFRGAAGTDRFNWKGRRQSRLKMRVAACAGCGSAGACEGPWARYVEMYGEGEFHAI
ncbi:MAG: radical SAM protein [Myxococcota bacterium]|jgi:cyclic pyranopterin phosphate synthase